VVEPNRLRGTIEEDSADATPRDRPISPRLPLFVGVGLVIAGLGMFAAGGTAQELGLGLVSLGAGIAMLDPLLRSVREIREVRTASAWQFVPMWVKPVILIRPVGLGIGVVILVGFAMFTLVVALGRWAIR
jgi:hypothetical protein